MTRESKGRALIIISLAWAVYVIGATLRSTPTMGNPNEQAFTLWLPTWGSVVICLAVVTRVLAESAFELDDKAPNGMLTKQITKDEWAVIEEMRRDAK